MKILMISPMYNELALLPFQLMQCKKYEIELFVIDNCSTDGTAEFLQKNNIKHCTLDTGGAFDLRPILNKMNEVVHAEAPDWVIYGAGDMFFEAEFGIRWAIYKADAEGFNQIESRLFQFKYFGNEIDPNRPFDSARLLEPEIEKRTFISKYSRDLRFMVDQIFLPAKAIKLASSVIFELHCQKTPEQRMETYARRKRAWDNGLPEGMGYHYEQGAFHNFTFNPDKLIPIENYPNEYKLLQKLQKLTNND